MKRTKKQKWFISLCMALLLTFTTGASLISAEEVGGAAATDVDNVFYVDVSYFVERINAEPGWDVSMKSHSPELFWIEEGTDLGYFDSSEMTMYYAHGDPNDTPTSVSFNSSERLYDPSTVRLGYQSNNGYGDNIWFFAIVCHMLNNDSYSYWLDSLTGTHMILSSRDTIYYQTTDARDMAYRMRGEGGFTQESISSAYISEYVTIDGVHDNNVLRVIAENITVFDYDYLDSCTSQITVDSSKSVLTISV